MEVLVHPHARVLSLKPGETLLQGLRAQSIPVSHSCEDGRCGMCRCRLVRGRMVELTRPPRQLFGCREKYVLACQASAAEDSAIVLPDGTDTVVHPSIRVRAAVLGVEFMSPYVRLLRLSNEPRLVFSPGQFAELEFTRGLSRVYSMAGLPEDDELQFHVRTHPHGRANRYLSESVERGTSIRVRGPYGAAWLRRLNSRPILCVAAGTGMAPLLSILRGIAGAGLANPVHVYAGFISSEEVYARDELNEILARIVNVQAVHVMVGGGQIEQGMRRGLLTEAIRSDFSRLEDWQAYVHGSPFAVDSVVQLLRRLGIAEDRLHADPFHPFGN